MAYKQDTIISANAANALALELHALLIAVGWTVVETMNPAGTNSPINRVYKSAGTSNQAGYDWYMVMMWKGTGTESWLQLIPCGAYDLATHTATQIPTSFSHSSTSTFADNITGDQWGGFACNVATAASGNVTPIGTGRGSAQTRKWFATVVPSSAFGYWASVTLDHVSLFTTITSANGPFNFIAGTLDVTAEWAALTIGNGVATNPVVCYFGTGTSGTATAPSYGSGVSVAMKGSNNSTRIGGDQRPAKPVGASLPVLTGPWLPAYAWKPAFFMASAVTTGGAPTSDPVWDYPVFGDGYHIGDAIDWWQVRGGAIGDTVSIDGGTHVLSGPFQASVASDGADIVTFGVLVE